jgi:hypothetical protein
MIHAHRLWGHETAHDASLRGVHSGREWGEGIVQAWCDRCDKLADARCVHEHGAGLYACMDESHVSYYETLVQASGPVSRGSVWCWGAMRWDGMHLWCQYALPAALVSTKAGRPVHGGVRVHHS